MLIKFDFSSKTGILVEKFAFATANLKIETLRTRRRFARVFIASELPLVLGVFIGRLGNCFFLFGEGNNFFFQAAAASTFRQGNQRSASTFFPTM